MKSFSTTSPMEKINHAHFISLKILWLKKKCDCRRSKNKGKLSRRLHPRPTFEFTNMKVPHQRLTSLK